MYNVGPVNLNWAFVLEIESNPDFFRNSLLANLTDMSDMWETRAWWKNFNLIRKIKALILNKYITVNVRHRAFKCWLAQTSGFVLLATVEKSPGMQWKLDTIGDLVWITKPLERFFELKNLCFLKISSLDLAPTGQI